MLIEVSGSIKRRDKWYFLRLGARWDRSVVPIYEAAARGKCVPLLKTLLTSHCRNECVYCAFRAGRNCPRTMWEPRKLAEITKRLWEERKIMGLFLSSSVSKDSDFVTERQLETVRTLRDMGYTGYIHLRLMPDVDRNYIREAIEVADRVGVNLEAPNKEVFSELCPDRGVLRKVFASVWNGLSMRLEERKSKQPNRNLGLLRLVSTLK